MTSKGISNTRCFKLLSNLYKHKQLNLLPLYNCQHVLLLIIVTLIRITCVNKHNSI